MITNYSSSIFYHILYIPRLEQSNFQWYHIFTIRLIRLDTWSSWSCDKRRVLFIGGNSNISNGWAMVTKICYIHFSINLFILSFNIATQIFFLHMTISVHCYNAELYNWTYHFIHRQKTPGGVFSLLKIYQKQV